MRKMVDLNCDLGEGFGHWSITEAPEEELIQIISSANIATGFHAGDPMQMNRLARYCKEHSVGFGAHPGFRDLIGFGRRRIDATPEELVNDIVYQVGALREFGQLHGVALQHVKPHGALYMEAARNEALSQVLLKTLRQISPDLAIFCMGISKTYAIAQALGQPVVREFYADRDYDDTGSIVFIRQPSAPAPDWVADKCLRACLEGRVETVSGGEVSVEFESICFHSDTPGALAIGRAIRQRLLDNGITIAPAATVISQKT